MNAPTNFVEVIDGVRYDVSKAMLLADNQFWDGSNWERDGRNRFLYRTPNGRYFTVRLSQWQGERDSLQPITEDDARELYETVLFERHVGYEDAFPNVEVIDA